MKFNLNILAILFSVTAFLVAAFTVNSLVFEASDAEQKECAWLRERAREEYQLKLMRAISRTRADQLDDLMRTLGAEDPFLCAMFTVGGGKKPKWAGDFPERLRNRLAGAVDRLVESVKIESGLPVRKGVESITIDNRNYLIVWQRIPGLVTRQQALAGARVAGIVVDYRRGYIFGSSRSLYDLIAVLVAGLTGLALVVVWLLVLSAQRTRREAALKTQFVANYAHELKTPLASLLLRAEMLKEGRYAAEEKRMRALEVIVSEGRRLNDMVLNLLDLIRIECRQLSFAREPFDVAETVRSVTETMRPFFAANGLEVRAGQMLVVCADAVRTREVLENLLSNASKYAAASGPVEVEAVCEDGQAVVRVLDRGPGLTPTQIKYVFDEYWRAEDGLTRETSGSGIGLFISREYARGMGGRLSVAAREGGGCTFTFELPLEAKKEDGENV